MNAIVEKATQSFLRKNIPPFRVGDQVRVDVKIVEGASERVQAFEGVVLRRRGHGISETFTVRKVSFTVGVERTFPLHSPRIESIAVLRSQKVRRARLYYLRDLAGKAARLQTTAGKPEAKTADAKTPVETKTPVAAA